VFNYIGSTKKHFRDQQPTYENVTKTTMMKKNQVGDDNTLTSVWISTQFAEATRMPLH